MWLLHFIPDSFLIWVINIVCIIGAISTGVGFFLGWVPGIKQYKFPLQLIGVALLVVGVYWKGGYSTEMEWRAKVEAMQVKVAAAEAKSKAANRHLRTKIVTKVKVIHDTKVIIRKEISKNSAKIDAECKISPDVISILNSAAIPPVSPKQGDVK